MTAHELAQAGLAAFLEALRPLLAAEADAAVRRALAERSTGPEPVWLTQVEAAHRAGVTPQTVRTWIDAGDLETGRNRRVSVASLERLQARRDSKRPAPPKAKARPQLPPTTDSRARLQIASALSHAGGQP
jgi:Helix-turn-helix domain